MNYQYIVREVNNWVAITLQIVIATTIFFRQLHHQARFFFAYIIWQTFSVAVIYALAHFGPPYWAYYSIWINDVVTVSLGFAIIIEVFNRIFAPYESIRRFARIVLFWSAVVLIVVAAFISTYREVANSVPILTLFLVAERSVRVVQLGLILCLFALSRYMHLRWRNYFFGISLGFGFYALLVLAGLTVRMYYGSPTTGLVNTILGCSYCASVMIWTFYVLQPDAVRVSIVALPSHELERWDESLARLLGRPP
jgi:hypothetical protein